MISNILIISTNLHYSNYIAKECSDEHHNVSILHNYNDIKSYLKNNYTDLIILDVLAVDKNILSIIYNISSKDYIKYIPIILLGSNLSEENRVDLLTSGVEYYLIKPINKKDLLVRIDSIMRTKSVIDELNIREQARLKLGITVPEIKYVFQDRKIALINFNPDNSKFMLDSLSSDFEEIEIVNNIRSIRKMLKDFSPDLCVIGSNSKIKDPLDIISMIRSVEELRHVFIMLESDNNILVEDEALNIGVNDCFSINNISKEELILRVKRQLRHKMHIDYLINHLEDNANDAIRDPLTNIFNRRYFDYHIDLFISEHKNKKLSLTILDIDGFKDINDKYGHQSGDLVLKKIANLCKRNIRVTDLIARYGGDEFVIVMVNTNPQESILILERLRKIISKSIITIANNKKLKVKISYGTAEYLPGKEIEDIITEADNNLYKTKLYSN